MIDIQRLSDGVRSAIDSVCEYAQDAETSFERIADLARNADEHNWKNAIGEIFDIAYSHY